MPNAYDLNQCVTPDTVVKLLRDAAEQYAHDAGDMDSTAFLDGRCWGKIAQELDRTADRIVKQCAKVGYTIA